ncbi:ABC transporter permease [Variovorax sp. ZS18.2.2]|uniref:ABC transporter permease n=1 Tax=Variovorax sp. ZS18.2.2 TaxID=2971255 RepID=UPI002151EE0A|nr:ABC transporter permease [Variovorax sp. ZS18.2.2]MCR6480877.1 ABC transporter permease [Variovorax sp. ZS18.2.2]
MTPSTTSAAATRGALQRRLRAYSALIALAAICIVFGVLSPDGFATLGNAANVLRQISFLVLVAVGATFVMSVSEYDLSVGATASLGGVLAAKLAVAGVGVPAQLAITLAAGFGVGVFNGLVVTRFRVLSFITTLATGTLIGGAIFWITDGATVFENIPDAFGVLGRGEWLSLSYPAWIMLATAAGAAFTMRQTVFGRQLQAIGGNTQAAFLAGIHVARYKTLAFGLCAALSALAGLLLASRLGSAQPTGGNALFLPAYAAVFLGVAASREGVPNVGGALVGAAILGVLANGLTILNSPTYLQDMLTGAIVIGAVIFQQIGRER